MFGRRILTHRVENTPTAKAFGVFCESPYGPEEEETLSWF